MNSKLTPRFLFLTFFIAIIGLVATESTWAAPVQSGDHGIEGDPGTDGQDGMDANDIFEQSTGFQWPRLLGVDGGHGGDGGKGVDGDDAGDDAAGGNGGNGGNGGKATLRGSELTSFSSAYGGAGGNGGRGGLGTNSMLDGQGGSGGNGGDAHVDLFVPRLSQIGSHAGDGGAGYGVGSHGGDGGRASFRASTGMPRFSGGFSTFRISAGDGGKGFDGANGGNGAATIVGAGDPFSLTGDDLAGGRNFRFLLHGGNGGDSENGVAGKAGTSRFHMKFLAEPLASVETTRQISNEISIFGGHGGRGISTGVKPASGTNGAAAFVQATDEPMSLGMNHVNRFQIHGGRGGSALGRHNSGDGGHGAKAGFLGRQVVEAGEAATNSIMNLDMRSGHGGHAQGTGRAGNGGSASFDDQVQFRTANSVRFNGIVVGGDGGWGKLNGRGGDALINLTNAVSQPATVNENQIITLDAVAFGGDAGQSMQRINSARGGDAAIGLIQTGARRVSLNARGFGGQGNWGRSGDATVRAFGSHLATPTDTGLSTGFRTANVNTEARSAQASTLNFNASIGGNAYAESRARAESNADPAENGTSYQGDARASASSNGGWGFQQSGFSHSIADATNILGNSYARATSHALGDRSQATDNFSLSESRAHGAQGIAQSIATSSGQVSHTTASAVSSGFRATAESRVRTETTNWRTRTHVLSTANYVAAEDSELINAASTLASSRFRAAVVGFGTGELGSETYVNLMPNAGQADALVADDFGMEDIFVDDPAARVLGIGSIFGGGTSPDPTEMPLSTHSFIDLSLESRDFFGDDQLILGLTTLGSSGEGFTDFDLEITYDGRSLIDTSFESLDEATMFFDSQLFDLGSTPADRELINLTFDVSMTFLDPTDQFGFGFVFGNANGRQPKRSSFNAVPEPSSVMVVALVMLGGLCRRRRK